MRYILVFLLGAAVLMQGAEPLRAAGGGTLLAQAAGGTVSVSGAVEHPASFALDDLRKLPVATQNVFFHTGKGGVRAVYTGVPLSALLDKVGLHVDPTARNHGLHQIVLAQGADGYYVVVSLAELDPEFGAQQAMLAYEQDGKPLAGARLVMPGDKGGARNVANVTSLQVRDITP